MKDRHKKTGTPDLEGSKNGGSPEEGEPRHIYKGRSTVPCCQTASYCTWSPGST